MAERPPVDAAAVLLGPVRGAGRPPRPPFAIACKAEWSIRLSECVRQVNRVSAKAGYPFGVAVAKATRERVQDGRAVDTATIACVWGKLREAGERRY
ncbi:hypothetical protein GCM10010211_76000 [Streptomyces albospinus]|uniref:Uncharacterized protein n=1 Tax=Streptomyces albospinus TaxID=285515 RepID=A0ABQ2VMK1_9ACTN|nr:hypothetical protein GCM10010211_76000 [Streptomyces albospinus]